MEQILKKKKSYQQNGRLSIKEDEPTKIIASSIKELLNEDDNFNRINVNITDFSEEKKELLRKSIRHYSKLDKPETNIEVTVNGEVRSCGKIFMDRNILNEFYKMFGKENIFVK